MISPEQHERAADLFLEAVRLSNDERDGFLDRHCDGDKALRSEVESLLVHDSDDPTDGVPIEAGLGVGILASDLRDEVHSQAAGSGIVHPERIGNYRLIRLIGHGGMGTVYEAEQEIPKRRVALKMVRPGLGELRLAERLQREAHVLGRLQHPNIAQVHEAGFTDVGGCNQPYFAMEYVDGLPIDEYVDQHCLTAQDRLELVARACEAIHYAHERGVLHRDLKPGNILVVNNADGTHQVKVLDFGVARMTDADRQLVTLHTEVGQLVGTISYMSPEQVTGRTDELDRRSDIYALGVILHVLLVGRLPHDVREHTIPEAVRIIREEDPSRLGSIDSRYRGDVETIVGKALEKDPDRRYRTAADMAVDIRNFIHDRPILARPASTFYQVRKFARRNQAIVGGAVLTLVALALGLMGTTWFAIAERRANDAAQRATYYASLAAASAALRENDVTAAERHLGTAPEPLRGWEWRHLNARLDASIRSVRLTTRARLNTEDYTRGRVQLWFSDGDAGGRTVHLVQHVRNNGTLHVEARRERTLELLSSWSAREIAAVTGVRSGNEVLLQADDGVVSVRSALTGELVSDSTVTWESPAARITSPLPMAASSVDALWRTAQHELADGIAVVSRDGKWLLTAHGENVRLISTRRPRQTLDLPPHPEGASNAAFSPDLRYVVTAGYDRRLQCFDLADGGRLLWVRDDAHRDAILAVAFSPDGSLLASGGQDEVLRFWDARTGAPRGASIGHHEPILAITFDATGDHVVTASAVRIKLWPVTVAGEAAQLWKNDWFVHRVRLFPDQATLVAMGIRGNITLWDPVAFAQIGALHIPREEHDWETKMRLTADWKLGVDFAQGYTIVADLLSGRVERRSLPAPGTALDMLPVPYRRAHKSAERLGRTLRVPALFLEQSNRLVTVTDERVLAIIDATDGTVLGELHGHTQPITSLAVLPGEERLISGSEDRTIRLWDLRTMEEVMDLRGHLDTVSWLAVTPDGATIFSVADDYTLRSWDTRTPSELFAARQEYQRAARRLTPYITDLIRERGDPDAVARQIDADESISERDRQIALHLLIRRGLAAVDDAINAEEQPRPQRKPPVAETEENDRRSATRS